LTVLEHGQFNYPQLKCAAEATVVVSSFRNAASDILGRKLNFIIPSSSYD